MVTTQVQTYQEASRKLLAQGFAELAQGDTRQASEKGWGAVAQALKSIAERRGWQHNGHRLIRRAASRLANETGDACGNCFPDKRRVANRPSSLAGS